MAKIKKELNGTKGSFNLDSKNKEAGREEGLVGANQVFTMFL
ncbi:13661_t:CDS:2, partial [Entrophospora sp. SA101]